MHQDGGVDLTAICMILQKGAKFLSQQNESKYPLLIRYIHFTQTRRCLRSLDGKVLMDGQFGHLELPRTSLSDV